MKGVNIHKGSKHKHYKSSNSTTATSSAQTFSFSSFQTPINCILEEEGCQNVVTSYFNKYTAICSTCTIFMDEKLKASAFSPDICPCCHQPSSGAPLSLCLDCLNSIQDDGYLDSSWGSWHLDRISGRIICIYLDFD